MVGVCLTTRCVLLSRSRSVRIRPLPGAAAAVLLSPSLLLPLPFFVDFLPVRARFGGGGDGDDVESSLNAANVVAANVVLSLFVSLPLSFGRRRLLRTAVLARMEDDDDDDDAAVLGCDLVVAFLPLAFFLVAV
jgi:hypothetical protein